MTSQPATAQSARIPVGDPEPDGTGARDHREEATPLQLNGFVHDGTLADLGQSRTDRVAAARDREAAALMLHQASLLWEAAAADRDLAALHRHEAALDRAASGIDELTGALRRRSGLPALQREIDRCRRSGATLALSFVDVDGLKEINDTYGHLAGDQLLRAVATHVRASLRAYDVVVRFGGDEFVYSLAGAELGAAEARFDRILDSLADAAPGHSATAGFAQLTPEDTLEALIARADADLCRRRRRRSDSREASKVPGGRDLDGPAHPAVQ